MGAAGVLARRRKGCSLNIERLNHCERIDRYFPDAPPNAHHERDLEPAARLSERILFRRAIRLAEQLFLRISRCVRRVSDGSA